MFNILRFLIGPATQNTYIYMSVCWESRTDDDTCSVGKILRRRSIISHMPNLRDSVYSQADRWCNGFLMRRIFM